LRDDSDLEAASSFFRAADADRALTSLFNDRNARSRIAAWKASDTRKPLELDHSATTPVGRVLRRGASAPQETQSFRAVLVRDQTPTGYHALTAYPLPED